MAGFPLVKVIRHGYGMWVATRLVDDGVRYRLVLIQWDSCPLWRASDDQAGCPLWDGRRRWRPHRKKLKQLISRWRYMEGARLLEERVEK